MDTAFPPPTEVDLHRLELRFADARLLEPRAIEALARSIEQCGQLIACIAVADADSKQLILVDGYPPPVCPACGGCRLERLVSAPQAPGQSAGMVSRARQRAAAEGHFSHYGKGRR